MQKAHVIRRTREETEYECTQSDTGLKRTSRTLLRAGQDALSTAKEILAEIRVGWSTNRNRIENNVRRNARRLLP